jgi:hypothetical protein
LALVPLLSALLYVVAATASPHTAASVARNASHGSAIPTATTTTDPSNVVALWLVINGPIAPHCRVVEQRVNQLLQTSDDIATRNDIGNMIWVNRCNLGLSVYDSARGEGWSVGVNGFDNSGPISWSCYSEGPSDGPTTLDAWSALSRANGYPCGTGAALRVPAKLREPR